MKPLSFQLTADSKLVLKDLRFNLRLNVFIANDIKNLGGIGIEEV